MKSAADLEIRPLGDAAIIVEVGERDEISPTVIDEVRRARAALQGANIPGVTEITTALASVALFYDPARVGERGATLFGSLEAQIRSALETGIEPAAGNDEEASVDVPVCYAAEFAMDVEEVARHAGLSADEVIRRHAAAEYRVAAVGFTPGFPYLTGLPAELATPRHPTPRTAVAAGAVAIGGSQTGIYPSQSPGGWQIIGRTPLRLFDPARQEPSLLRAGDRVRFREISRDEFGRVSAGDQVQAPANK